MFSNSHSFISILIVLVYDTVQCFSLSFEALGNKQAINALHNIKKI